MARVTIYDKSGAMKRDMANNQVVGSMRYVGQTMKARYVEFKISAPAPIDWKIGDYVDYGGDTLWGISDFRFRLFSLPQVQKVAESETYGGAFVYDSVQFYDAGKIMELAPWTDLRITNDNLVFYSNREGLSTFENVDGIRLRIQACLNSYCELLPSTDPYYGYQFEVSLNTSPSPTLGGEDAAAYMALVTEARQFSFSDGQSCFDALNEIGNVWPQIGWSYTDNFSRKKVTIAIGNLNFVGNATRIYRFDPIAGSYEYPVMMRHDGIVTIKRYATNLNDFLTVLVPYGSDRNVITRYYNKRYVYNGDGVLNGQSDDIPNLMLPISEWGTTVGKWDWSSSAESARALPDPRKTEISDPAIVAKYGTIKKVVRFDNDETGDIYPSLAGVTIQNLWDAMPSSAPYYPDANVYTGSERVDEVITGSVVGDNGIISVDGESINVSQTINYSSASNSSSISANSNHTYTKQMTINNIADWTANGLRVTTRDFNIIWSKNAQLVPTNVTLRLSFISPSPSTVVGSINYDLSDRIRNYVDEQGMEWSSVSLDNVYYAGVQDYVSRAAFAYLTFAVRIENHSSLAINATVKYPQGTLTITNTNDLAPTTEIDIPQIGFDVKEQLSDNDGYGTINMKTGDCAGRSFKIIGATHYVGQGADDLWTLKIQRETDASTGMVYPNSTYRIASGDKYVITDIQMPELYIGQAEQRLLTAAQKYYSQHSFLRYLYDLDVDSKWFYAGGSRAHPIVDAGFYIPIIDNDLTEGETKYVLVDTVTISENENNIPTIKITLRERLSLPSTQI